MADLHGFTEEELQILQRALNKLRGLRVNPPSRPSGERTFNEGEDHQSPELYVCTPPPAGIPPLTLIPNDEDQPGQAVCNIYKIVINQITGLPELKGIQGLQKTVYNISLEWIIAPYHPTYRTAYGKWIAWTVDFEDITTGTGTGTETACPQIRGVDFADLASVTDPDFVLGIKDGCLVKVPVETC